MTYEKVNQPHFETYATDRYKPYDKFVSLHYVIYSLFIETSSNPGHNGYHSVQSYAITTQDI